MTKRFNAFTLAGATHVETCKNSSKNGFTLAEVLITLGIIGVVAAMTMPTLINQTNGAQYKAAYKKALSAISQAVTLNVALDDISFADTSNTIPPAKILSDRMNVVSTLEGAGNASNADGKWVAAIQGVDKPTASNTTLFFNDGSAFSFLTADYNCRQGSETETNKICYGFIDVNGYKGPNKTVTCDGKSISEYNDHVDNCTVKSPTDIYPVQYYDQTILPSTDAGRTVLYGQ